MSRPKIIITLIIAISILTCAVLFIGVSIYTSLQKLPQTQKGITSFSECTRAGGVVREKFPAECETADGDIFEQPVSLPLETGLQNIRNFVDCVDAGYPIAESYPPQCYTPDGRSFTMSSQEK